MTQGGMPAGWYEDPGGGVPGAHRWWDGERWTSHVMPPPPPPPPPPPTGAGPGFGPVPAAGWPVGPTPGGRTGRPWWQRKRVILPAGLVGLLMVAGALSDGGTGGPIAADRSSNPPTSVSTTVRATTTTAVEAAVASTPVPATAPPSTATTVAPASTAAPLVGGVTTTTRGPASTAATTRRTAAVGSSTTVRKSTTTAAAGKCDPNYAWACVPIASDVDCYGGGGNGPAYVKGPVKVVGTDIYGLDGNDNDGIGCE